METMELTGLRREEGTRAESKGDGVMLTRDEEINEMISYLYLAERTSVATRCAPTLISFGHPFMFPQSDIAVIKKMRAESFGSFIRPFHDAFELGLLIEASVAGFANDGGLSLTRARIGRGCHRIFRDPLKSVNRRHPTHKGHWMARFECADIERDGSAQTAAVSLCRMGGDWIAGAESDPSGDLAAMRDLVEFETPSIWLASKTNWVASIGFVGHPGLSFLTSPEGCKALFRLRDIPNGASRRTAIVHWVREHQRRISDDTKVTVSEHFRGSRSFSWNGLECSVAPSVLSMGRYLEEMQKLRDANAQA